ncbi:uncharacterized protein si:dkey-102g19.3 [Chanodichthys erythropterus]|uniref:uncharacterized protein si:dkey-102g19.3 n=1 Tax=Chanodichthys erythropterus TaxID=933992 RepID=UPI00351EDF53
MHLQVSIALLFILLTGGFSLECYECMDQQDCSRKTCYTENCRSTKTLEYFGPYREEADNWQRERDRIPRRIKYKHAACPAKGRREATSSRGCGLQHECKSWSLGTGCWTREYISECCDTYLCNREASGLSHKLNGKRCFTCDEEDCSKTISCWGDEDYCFTAFEPSSHQLAATKGCASKSACDQEPGKILGFHGNITCCEGNLLFHFLFLFPPILSFIVIGPYREEADNRQRERDRIPSRIKYKHAACPGKGITDETISYGCAKPHECKSWSLGTGCWIREHSSKCCNTNLCNRQSSVSFSHIPNGKRCFTCDEEDCSKTISCWGNEEYCFTAFEPSSHQSAATKGCASKSACDQEPGTILGFHGNITCCEGNLCNGAIQSSTYNSAPIVTQSSTCNRVQSVTQRSTSNGAQSVSQSFLFLCRSLLSYFLLH